MQLRQTWPFGVRLIFALSVIEFFVFGGQTAYWTFVTHDLLPEIPIWCGYAAVAFVLSAASIAAGAFSKRRTLVLFLLLNGAYHLCATLLFNLEIFSMVFPSVLDGNWRVLLNWSDRNIRLYNWNSMCILLNASICYYILLHELRIHVA